MAKYQVGQRVRIKWTHRSENQHLVGKESHIIKVNESVPWSIPENHGKSGYALACFAVGTWFLAEQLEPIIPDGAKPSEFKDVNELLYSLQLEEVLCESAGK